MGAFGGGVGLIAGATTTLLPLGEPPRPLPSSLVSILRMLVLLLYTDDRPIRSIPVHDSFRFFPLC